MALMTFSTLLAAAIVFAKSHVGYNNHRRKEYKPFHFYCLSKNSIYPAIASRGILNWYKPNFLFDKYFIF